MPETIEPTIDSILNLQILEKDVNDESSTQTWTCVSYASNVLTA
ncbi:MULTISPECIES: hypothetical protein [Streptacidiphilus]|uniref:SapB/AmfS family lantipeptide n=2 Tax=Streptacidiphilus TaxID=228398 RepID=A0ABV6UIF9_9ACTN|nr:hypothetical protein [Streptacidiphilus jeojiense]